MSKVFSTRTYKIIRAAQPVPSPTSTLMSPHALESSQSLTGLPLPTPESTLRSFGSENTLSSASLPPRPSQGQSLLEQRIDALQARKTMPVPSALATKMDQASAESTDSYLRRLRQATKLPEEHTLTTEATATGSSITSKTSSASSTRSGYRISRFRAAPIVSKEPTITTEATVTGSSTTFTTSSASTCSGYRNTRFTRVAPIVSSEPTIATEATATGSSIAWTTSASFTRSGRLPSRLQSSRLQKAAPTVSSEPTITSEATATGTSIASTTSGATTRSFKRASRFQPVEPIFPIGWSGDTTTTGFSVATKTEPTISSPRPARQSRHPDIVCPMLTDYFPLTSDKSLAWELAPEQFAATEEEDSMIIRFVNKLGACWGEEGKSLLETMSWKWRKANASIRQRFRHGWGTGNEQEFWEQQEVMRVARLKSAMRDAAEKAAYVARCHWPTRHPDKTQWKIFRGVEGLAEAVKFRQKKRQRHIRDGTLWPVRYISQPKPAPEPIKEKKQPSEVSSDNTTVLSGVYDVVTKYPKAFVSRMQTLLNMKRE